MRHYRIFQHVLAGQRQRDALAPVSTGFARLTFFHGTAASQEFRWNAAAVAELRRR